MKVKIFFVFLTLFLVLVVPACSAVAQSTPTPSLEPPTATVVLPSETPKPTFTLALTNTSTTIPSATLPPTPTATFTPAANYAQFKLLAVSKEPYGMLLGFQIPGLTDPLITRINTQLFKCTMDAKYPERMFCSGPALPLDKYLDILFYAVDGADPVYTGQLIIASQIFKAPTPANIDMSNACPEDLASVSCETENRTDKAGNPCKVSTCVNRCGYLYSVNTCPDLH
jgi:hypothetical protein